MCAQQTRDAFEGKGPQRRPQKRLDRRLEEVAKAVGGGYCRLQMPLSLVLAVRGTVSGHRLGALDIVCTKSPPPTSPPYLPPPPTPPYPPPPPPLPPPPTSPPPTSPPYLRLASLDAGASPRTPLK